MKKILNKWQIHFYFGRDYQCYERGWKKFEFGILKIKRIPDEGESLHKQLYDGFITKFYLWLPIDSA